MPSIDWNRRWGCGYKWEQDGDEWSDQASYSGVPYEVWKQALVDDYIAPYLCAATDVLEIGPGRGRWTEYLLKAKRLCLVDLNAECLEYCRNRFPSHDGMVLVHGDGRSLLDVPDGSIDFIWSFDSFVHMERDVVAAYLRESARVLRKDGLMVIHHSGCNEWSLRFKFLSQYGGPIGEKCFNALSMGSLRFWKELEKCGQRSLVSPVFLKQQASESGFLVVSQNQQFGKDGRSNVRLFNDWISLLRKS